MTSRLLSAAALALALTASACAKDEPPVTVPPPPVAAETPVYTVDAIEIGLMRSASPSLHVTVRGTARQGGWTNIHLRPLETFAAEVDQVSFVLVGTPPDGPATDALMPVVTEMDIGPLAPDVLRIVVHAETNQLAQDIPGK